MDPYVLTIKYVFRKYQKENNDKSINEFFMNGLSFPQFVAILFEIDKIPGTNNNPKNIFQINNNNSKALEYLGNKNTFFKSYQIDFKNTKNQILLINLILGKIYFKINKASFLKRCNDYLLSNELIINNFSEFINGNGFIKLLNVASKMSIPPEIEFQNADQMLQKISEYLSTLNIPIIIDKTSFLPENQDLLMFQGLLIMDSTVNINSNSTSYFPQNEKNISTEKNLKSDENSKIIPSMNKIKNENEKLKDHIVNKKEVELNKIATDEHQIKLDENIQISSTIEMLNLPKSSYLNIINHILIQNDLECINYLSDFANGSVLPKFIEILMKEKVPNIKNNPIGNDQLTNNMECLFFLKSKYQSFSPENYILKKEEDLKKLIRFIMMKSIFTNDYLNRMKNDCNSILSKFKVHIDNFNKDWSNGVNFIGLLNFLSKGDIEYPPNKSNDLNKLKMQFSKANCKFIIEDDALFENTDELIILYQIRIIIQTIKMYNLAIPKIENAIEIIDDKKVLKYNYDKNSCPILRAFNAIGAKIGLHYKSMDEIIDGMTLHILVQHLMDADEIPGIRPEKENAKANIDAVMEFLSDNNTIFQYLKFDFDDKIKRNENIKCFSTTLLSQLFLKENKTQIMKKVGEWVDRKVQFNDMKKFFIYGKGFYQMLGISDVDNINKYDEKMILDAFQKSNVPFILDEDSLTSNINNDYISFQLQFIFDNAPKTSKQDNNNHNVEALLENSDDQEEEESNKKVIETKQSINEIDTKSDSIRSLDSNDDLKQLKQMIEQQEEKPQSILSSSINQSVLSSLKRVKNTKTLKLKPPSNDLNIINNNDNMKENENMIENDDEPDYLFSDSTDPYKLYTFKTSKNKINEIRSKFTDEFNRIFRNTCSQSQKYKSTEDLWKNYKPTNNVLKIFKLFQYKSNKWSFNSFQWSDFIATNDLNKDNMFHFILMPPCCTTDKNIDNDLTFKFVRNITTCKTEEKLSDEAYVELCFCGAINDIKTRFGIEKYSDKNDYLSILQIRYPPSLKDNIAIINMQSVLMLICDINLSFFSCDDLDDSTNFVNTCMYQSSSCYSGAKKDIQLILLIKDQPTDDMKEYENYISNPQFVDDLVSNFNTDKNVFKKIKYLYEFSFPSIQWIDITNYKTYNAFLMLVIDICSHNHKRSSILLSYTKTLSKIADISDIENQINMFSYMYKMKEVLEIAQEKEIKYYPIFKIDSVMTFNQSVFDSFLSDYEINMYTDSMFTILFCDANNSIANNIISTFSKRSVNKNEINEIKAFIEYGGTIEDYLTSCNIKIDESQKIKKCHLAFIKIAVPIYTHDYNREDLILFQTSIASQCDVVIMSDYINDGERIFNALNFYNMVETKNSIKIPEFILYTRGHYSENTNKNLFYKIFENGYSDFNLRPFFSEIFHLLSYSDNQLITNVIYSFRKVKNLNLQFYVHVFQYITKVDSQKNKSEKIYSITDEKRQQTSLDFVNYLIRTNDILSNYDILEIFDWLLKSFKENSLRDILCKIRDNCIYVNTYLTSNSLEINMISPSEFFSDFDEFLDKEISYIDENYREILKNSTEEKIKDFIYNEIKKIILEKKIPDEMIMPIYELKLEEYKDFIAECMNYIDNRFAKEKLYKTENVEMDQQKINQNSMRYILAVKESIKEVTVEILSDDELKNEIPQDF